MDPFADWLEALAARHLQALEFAEIRRAVQALSSLYVERRPELASGRALAGRGKRAAFALYYAPLHFLLVREVVRALGAARPPPSRIVDLGCGTGAAGAAWAVEAGPTVRIEGVDRHPWAVSEARWTYSKLGLSARARVGELARVAFPERGAVLAAFTVNELTPAVRDHLLERALAARRRGVRVLVVEPIGRRGAPWWEQWAAASVSAGGRADRWRFAVELPELLRRLDQAAGLDHRELTGRSLYF